MFKIKMKKNPTSVILRVKLLDAAGAGKTGLTYLTSGLKIAAIKIGEAVTAIYASSSGTIQNITTRGTYETPAYGECRFRELDATYHPGVYELQFANSRFENTTQLLISITGAADLAQFSCDVDMESADANLTEIVGDAVDTAQPQLGVRVNTMRDQVIESDTIAMAAIHASAIAYNAINANSLKADAITKIQAGLANEANMKDVLLNKTVVSRHANQKPAQYKAGTGTNQETINTTIDILGNIVTETKV